MSPRIALTPDQFACPLHASRATSHPCLVDPDDDVATAQWTVDMSAVCTAPKDLASAPIDAEQERMRRGLSEPA